MKLTDEQFAIVDQARRGERLRIVAYAGAGKTSTLRAIAGDRPTVRGLYMAFNRAIAVESQSKFSGTAIDCRTAHSLAYRWAAGEGFATAKLTGRPDARTLRHVGIVAELRDRPAKAMAWSLSTLRKWMQSALSCPETICVPSYVPEEYRQYVLNQSCLLWQAMRSKDEVAPLGHDGYLKLWALTRPSLPYHMIMVDEAQDLNPVLVDVLKRQTQQLISVGDPYQQIYQWRGAVDALKILPGNELHLTQSFRFGGEIEDLANCLLRGMGEARPLRGNGRSGFVGPLDSEPDAILCRTNGGVFAAAAARPGCAIAGGAGELLGLLADVERLQDGQAARGPDLCMFESWREVVDACDSEDMASLAPIVRLVEQHGVAHLRGVLERTRADGAPLIGTAHKTKGLEFGAVELAGDFACAEPGDDEKRLFYVACTRARFELGVHHSDVEPFL